MENLALESKFTDGPDGRVHYQELGEGPAVILIHGGGPGAMATVTIAETSSRYRSATA